MNEHSLPDLPAARHVTAADVDRFASDGHVLLRDVASEQEVAQYRDAIADVTTRLSRELRPIEERDTYGKAFQSARRLHTVAPGRDVLAARRQQVPHHVDAPRGCDARDGPSVLRLPLAQVGSAERHRDLRRLRGVLRPSAVGRSLSRDRTAADGRRRRDLHAGWTVHRAFLNTSDRMRPGCRASSPATPPRRTSTRSSSRRSRKRPTSLTRRLAGRK